MNVQVQNTSGETILILSFPKIFNFITQEIKEELDGLVAEHSYEVNMAYEHHTVVKRCKGSGESKGEQDRDLKGVSGDITSFFLMGQ